MCELSHTILLRVLLIVSRWCYNGDVNRSRYYTARGEQSIVQEGESNGAHQLNSVILVVVIYNSSFSVVDPLVVGHVQQGLKWLLRLQWPRLQDAPNSSLQVDVPGGSHVRGQTPDELFDLSHAGPECITISLFVHVSAWLQGLDQLLGLLELTTDKSDVNSSH